MDNLIYNEEKQNLSKVLKKVTEARSILEERLSSLGKKNLEKLKDLKEDPETSGADYYLFLEQMHQDNQAFNVKDKFQKLDELQLLEKEPYFSRIDLKDNTANGEELQTLYIGKFGYTEKLPIVTDWRAKIASVYYRYRYPQKNVKYDTPDGLEVRDLELKRTFDIDNGTLIKYYNNDLQIDESEIISDKITKRTGGVLEDIIETIQVSQLNIIEADPRQVCIVQGCVGSGKSTVAIHKLSHIFFNYPDLIKPERAILIAKNQILVGYLSTLFPKLGIFDINYKSLRELIYNFLFREEIKLRVDFELPSDEHIDLNNLKAMKNRIETFSDNVRVRLEYVFSDSETESYGGFKYSKQNTPYENITEGIADLEEELLNQKDMIAENPKSIKAYFYKDNIKSLKKIINNLKKLRTEMVNVDFPKILKMYGLDLEGKLNYEQTLLFIYLYLEIVGIKNFKKYEYCVIDEGQDFNVLEYMVLGKLIIHGRFCILGDLNQAYDTNGIKKWEDISEVIDAAKHAQVFSLDTNYRSTKQIIDFANQILSPYTDLYLPKSINRVGSMPEVLEYSTREEMLKVFIDKLKTDVDNIDKSIGIIIFDLTHYDQIRDAVYNVVTKNKTKLIELDPHIKITYIPKGVYLTSFENCKGLEFAKVYVLDLNLSMITNFGAAKRSFVSVTRAMNELCIFSTLTK